MRLQRGKISGPRAGFGFRKVFITAIGLISSSLFFLTSAHAGKEVRYKDYALDLREGDRLVLIGFKGNVRVSPVGAGRGSVLRARKAVNGKPTPEQNANFEQTGFNVRREEHALIVEQTGADARAPLTHALKGDLPELDYEVEAIDVPLEVSMREGQVLLSYWKQGSAISLVKGQIRTTNCEGLIRAQIQHGEVRIEKHHGRVELDSYGAKVFAQDVNGDVQVSNFAGDSTLSDVHGAIDAKSEAGPLTINKSSGSVDFISGRSAVTLQGFEGPVRGQTDQGAVVAAVDGEAEVRIESNQGPVTVKLPNDSGAFLRLQSEEGGTLTAPESIRAVAKAKLVSGKLIGNGPKGSVAIKTKTANARIRL